MSWWGPYVGVPYGDRPGELECWGLVRTVMAAERGLELPAYGETSALYLAALARLRAREATAEEARAAREAVAAEIAAGRAAECWQRATQPQAFDVALMARSGAGQGAPAVHCGLMVDQWHILHTTRATGAVCVPIAHPSVPPIIEFRRHG